MKNDLNDLFITRIETDTANNPLYSEMISETDHERVLLNGQFHTIFIQTVEKHSRFHPSEPLHCTHTVTIHCGNSHWL